MPEELRDQLFLKPSEVARRLDVHRSTIYKWMDDGELPSVRVGPKTRRIPVGALDAYIERQQDGAVQRERAELANLVSQSVIDPDDGAVAFTAETEHSPETFIDRWRSGALPDTAENTRLALRALALRAAQQAATRQTA
jgi:excisionase family DNA binding protein